jgi:hypothetical protein
MKRIARNLMVMAVFAMALTGFALAQQFAYRVEANVPVDFYAGDHPMNAGTYLIAVNYGDNVVTIKNQATGQSAVVHASPVVYGSPGYDTRNRPTTVELRSVGGRYVLAEVQTRTSGVEFPLEGNANRGWAKNGETITVVVSLR